uniref:Inhibitor_I29 domain-containing protein n=1 Tax=Panagrellus redivivus TaxID=6233 RepID=A0A7E4UZL2_PANRE
MHTLFWIAIIASVGRVAIALTDLEQWENFKKTYEKNYTDPVEDAYHFAVFKNSLKEVKEHNDRYNRHEVTFAIRIIDLSDIPKDQWPTFPPLPTVDKDIHHATSDEIEEDIRKALEQQKLNP